MAAKKAQDGLNRVTTLLYEHPDNHAFLFDVLGYDVLEIVKRLSKAYKDSRVPHSASFSAASIRGAFSPPGSVRRFTSLSICFSDGAEPRFRKSNIEKRATKKHKRDKFWCQCLLWLLPYFH